MALGKVDISMYKPGRGMRVNRATAGLGYLSMRERKMCAARFRAGDAEAGEMLIASSLGQVYSAAIRNSCRGVPIDDLVQEGCLGVLQAAKAIDPTSGWHNMTIISGYISRQIDDAVLRYARNHGPFDAALDQEKFSLADEKISIGRCTVSNALVRTLIERMLSELRPRESQVIRLRFGLDGGYPLHLDEISKIMDITGERVRQIEAHALRRLRHPVRSRELRVLLGINEPFSIPSNNRALLQTIFA